MTKCKELWVFVWMICAGLSAFGQISTGTISGTVKDGTGGVLPGVKVEIQNEETGVSRAVASNELGRYIALSLSPGRYRVSASLTGFRTAVHSGIGLTVGREFVVDLLLEVGEVVQTLEVTGQMPLVESTSASLGALVDEHTIRELPLNGRSYDQLALLQPGVVLFSAPGGDVDFRMGTSKRFSVGGQRSTSNSFLLDGTDINDHANGTPGGSAGTNLGVDTILEFKIFTSTFKAEYGRSNGSVTTAVTRSGTNSLHGTVFEDLRNSALDARNFFDIGSVPPFKRNQFGGVLGGPIKKDRMFFFGGYEGLRERLGTTTIATVPTASARQGILPSRNVQVSSSIVPYFSVYPLPNGRDFGDGTGEFIQAPTIVTNEDYYTVRLDRQLGTNNSIFGRYTFDDDNLNQPVSIPHLVQLRESRRQYSTVQVSSTLGPRALNGFRFAFNRSNSRQDRLFLPDPGPALAFVPGQQMGTIAIGGVGSTGSRPITEVGPNNGAGNERYAYSVFQWSDDFSYILGNHSLKTGINVERVRNNFQWAGFIRGSYTFNTLEDFLAGTPTDLTAQSPLVPPQWGLRQTLLGVYFQDDYNVNSRLNVNLGIRWEATTDPIDAKGQMSILHSPADTSMVVSDRFFSIPKKSFAPRLGIAWKLNESGKTVLRAGAGVYHNQILPWVYFNNIFVPPFFDRFSIANPRFPDGFRVIQDGGGRPQNRLNTMAPVNKIPVNYQFSFSLQHEVFKDTLFQISYSGNKSSQLLTNRDQAIAIPTILPDGRKFYAANLPRRNPVFAGIRTRETDGNSFYNAFTVLLRRESANGLQGQIHYTFSRAIDEASTTLSGESLRSPKSLLDPFDRARDRGLADFNAEHVVVFNLSYQLPVLATSRVFGAMVNGWSLNSIGTFSAGLPFTPRLGTAVSRDRNSELSERPDLRPGADANPNDGISVGCDGFTAGTRLGGADNFFDPCSFSMPQDGTYGNLGRNTVIGPGIVNLDFAVAKAFKLREETELTFKTEVFNILNRSNFGLPNPTPLAAPTSSAPLGRASSSAGRITNTATSSRQIQFALRLSF